MATFAMADIVSKPATERLVNDFAGILSARESAALEDSLVRYAKRTSTQVTIVTVNDLDGYDPSEYAYKIGESWGIGQKGKNNGVVILVKPKLSNSDKGRAFIAPGYGLEGVLPDITCRHIVANEMIPHFANNDYASGIVAGAVAVMKACEGEYTGDQEEENDNTKAILIIIAFIAVFFIFVPRDNNKGGGNHMSSGGLSDAIFMSTLLNSMRGHNSDWGSFSGGRGSFGGFGGGSFGGGGGGGSW